MNSKNFLAPVASDLTLISNQTRSGADGELDLHFPLTVVVGIGEPAPILGRDEHLGPWLRRTVEDIERRGLCTAAIDLIGRELDRLGFGGSRRSGFVLGLRGGGRGRGRRVVHGHRGGGLIAGRIGGSQQRRVGTFRQNEHDRPGAIIRNVGGVRTRHHDRSGFGGSYESDRFFAEGLTIGWEGYRQGRCLHVGNGGAATSRVIGATGDSCGRGQRCWRSLHRRVVGFTRHYGVGNHRPVRWLSCWRQLWGSNGDGHQGDNDDHSCRSPSHEQLRHPRPGHGAGNW